MAKLTRTQKYANLRDELANNKETNYTSQDLSSYANRFNNVQDTLAPRPVVDQTTQAKPDYVWQPFQQETVNTVVEPVVETKVEPVAPVVEQAAPVVEQAAPVVEQKIEEVKPVVPATPVVAPVEQPAPAVEEKKEEVKEAVEEKAEEPKQAEQAPASTGDYFDSFLNDTNSNKIDVNDFSSFFEDETTEEVFGKDDQGIEDTFKGVFDDVDDTTDNTISKKERDTYLNQTISDVNFHNIVNGEKTIGDIVDNVVDEVRHPEVATKPIEPVIQEAAEEIVDNTYAWASFDDSKKELDADEPVKANKPINSLDEEFSNTVSVEISKIMDSMTPQTKSEETVDDIFKTVGSKSKQQVIKQEVAEEKAEEVVEIKNISELNEEPLKNTVSGTIPFVVSADDDEDIEEDEDEDEGSNTVLNIILIILILVLIAVLGLIVFYILKTKGIF